MIVLEKIKKFLFILVVALFATNSYAATKADEYVGSKACEKCHQKVYKEYKKTLHSQMIKDVKENPRAIIGDFESKSDIRTFKKEDVLYTIGNQWKQRYITKKGDELYILPAQYNLNTGKWKPYHAKDWDKRPWLKKCGQCHVTGLNYEKRTFKEPGVGCESCHGPGLEHIQSKKPAQFAKNIVNPATLAVGLQVQICGSCHTRGKDPSGVHGYPKGFKPGESLLNKYNTISKNNKKKFWPNGHSKGHHQQYLDWQDSTHAKEGVTCVSCHTVHSTGSATRYQTRLPGNKLCLNCHTPSSKKSLTHSIHDFGSCIGCHMPKIVKSAESGDLHDHTWKVTPPSDTIKFGGLKKQQNSCNSCHYHKNDSPKSLQKYLDDLKKNKKIE
jgi:predicted CXXCH cytochrome family protein